MWLVEKFSDSESTDPVATDCVTTDSVATDPDSVTVTLDGQTHELSRTEATELRDALGDALTAKREFLHTAGEHRQDGTYQVSRRSANSAGHSKVFESFEHLTRLYGRLPEKITAEEVGRTGLTSGRRHLLVRHFTEHPAFDCELVSRQPLTVQKCTGGETGE